MFDYKFLFYTIFLTLVLFGCFSKTKSNQIKQDTIHLSFDENYSSIYTSEDDFDYPFAEKFVDFKIIDESRFIDGNKFQIKFNPKGDYNHLKQEIKIQREVFRQNYLNAKDSVYRNKIINDASSYITETLLNKIFPFWYGMPWDLAGYSDIPCVGEVGCSYFVSNTLKHCGFKLNRYRLAQQNTLNIGLSLQISDSLLIIKGNSEIKTIKNYFNEYKKEGLYYVGLDSHVGFLLYRKGEVFFIQSNYAEPVEVLIEYSDKSDVFLSNKYYIADITFNKKLIHKWILNEEIKVVME